MFQWKKLSFATLSAMLALSGLTACGGGSDNATPTTGNPNTPPINTNLSELDQAKELIKTAKLFVTDADAVKKTYEGASDILTLTQQARLGTALDIPSALHMYMRDRGLTTMTAEQIKLASQPTNQYGEGLLYNDYLYNVSLVPSSDFKVSLTADDQFSMTGSLTAIQNEYEYRYSVSTGWTEQLINSDTFAVAYDGYKDTLERVQLNTSSISGTMGFNSIKVGTGADLVTVTSNAAAMSVAANFSKNVNFDTNFDLSDAQQNGVTLTKGSAALKNITLTANNNIIKANELSVVVLSISNQVNDETIVRTVPYQLTVSGQLQMATPKTDIAVTLNASAKEADIKNILTINTNKDVVEKSSMTLPITALVSIKGQATGENNKLIPLDFQANLTRKDGKVIALDGLTAQVEGKTLYATGSSTFDAYNNMQSTNITFKQNSASVIVTFDKDNRIISTNGKVADIMVDGKDYGDLMQNGGQVTAKFIDNSLITL